MAIPKNYYNFFDICKLEGIPTGTAKGALSEGIEGIARIEKLKPIGHLFKEFEKGMRKQYGILRRHYEFWKMTGETPKVSPGRPKKYEGRVKNYRIVAPPFDHIFDAGMKKMNKGRIRPITKQEFIWLALKEAMERRPQFFDWDDADGNE